MTTSIIGFPRIGAQRELKRATEKYWKGNLSQAELVETAQELKNQNWQQQADSGIDYVSTGDFSFFDNLLDTANLLNIIPHRYKTLDLDFLDQYFAQARGYQDENHSVKALPMKKWFNTNYHYLVPEFEDDTQVKVNQGFLFQDLQTAAQQHQHIKTSLVGPFTLLKLSHFSGSKQLADFVPDIINAYRQILQQLTAYQLDWLELDEPSLVYDLTAADKELFETLYQGILAEPHHYRINLQTYFGDVRDIYQELINLPVDGIGLDFIEGKNNIALLQQYGFPKEKVLFAGVVNGKNIWRNQYQKTIELLKALPVNDNLVISTSASLLHVPYTVAGEAELEPALKQHLSFAYEKLTELHELDQILWHDAKDLLVANQTLFKNVNHPTDLTVTQRVQALTSSDYERLPLRSKREAIQKAEFKIPELPTTTIGSFPQTPDVRKNRADYRHHEIDQATYDQFNRDKIKRIITWQEKVGFDVLVHGEYERNDMVEYFGENLSGFAFTKNAWVQSYGSRGVKPPIIWGDVSRKQAITVAASTYAQSLTDKPVKGMLTGPVTIFNWSFPREDISAQESVTQIALAIQDEVLDLEKHGIKIIQIDEAALREKLPLRQSDWYKEYLDWAIPAFKLVHSPVQASTQIHTHMCYSEFNDIIPAIDQMDADVISFEASRSDLSIIDELKANHFETEVGPGVYDIHSPRIPSQAEIYTIINKILAKLPVDKVWINPDCGLKTRGESETFASLKNLIAATHQKRRELSE
ncbi:5-methyltetrahydropteroyltriglutamate--homocysteine S-methyltransferase [Convivina intestini]|uniref:5-methyltetrahydropteroyltriglutamate--homocysteine methyltransferase n=1 Tax=Convivina intestini TaxID=1505726 RepID=A0A2U1D9H7_9LACO|nr:5-methyltetrahydropteroyltriglutamate--homocysteine S-methyltransferase [Convivina intestini]PVY84344.1 methionine synthase (B12-independent) [Convivina intestini]CAH1857041.1 5-methyltetrahydropteroyltriglutamate--homocysteine methyltransferase [Convivina intestini]SDC06515.1 methionine synthase (B12-independent) [Leuconostocaceae bacterium R-53105]